MLARRIASRIGPRCSRKGLPVAMHKLPVIALEGTGRQRGEAHGESARDLVREAAERWRRNVLDDAPMPAADYLHTLVSDSRYRAAIERHAPDLLDEMAGIARAAAVDERIVFGMNLLDEEWALRGRATGTAAGCHCTS